MPGVRYCQSRDGHVAFETYGDGDIDLAFVIGYTTHLEVNHRFPGFDPALDRLSRFARVIHYDERGTGLSDPIPRGELVTIEDRVDDLMAVLDAAGADRPFVIGHGEGGPVAITLAASRPHRCRALVLSNAFARVLRDDDYEIGIDPAVLDGYVELTRRAFEDEQHAIDLACLQNPSLRDRPDVARQFARAMRMSSTPAQFVARTVRVRHTDVRSLLPHVGVPVLVLHAREDRVVPLAAGRYLAEHLPAATMVELPGGDDTPTVGDFERWAAEVEAFATGARHETPIDRLLATVLFTDIVASTATASRMGDRVWAQLLDRHDDMVRRQVDRFDGTEVTTTGDGFVVRFDGPARAISCAHAVCDGAAQLGLQVRAGVHTGEVVVRGHDVAGVAVHLASRISSLAGAGEILVSRTVKDLVAGSGLRFASRGVHRFKGVDEPWEVHAVEPV